jgi:hypothetical protein
MMRSGLLRSESLTFQFSAVLLLHNYQWLISMYNNDLDRLLILASTQTSLLHFQLKRLHFFSLLIRLCVAQTQASKLGILITFVNSFHFNYHCI